MSEIKKIFIKKNESSAYEELTLFWPCVEKMTKSLITLLPGGFSKVDLAAAISRAVIAYNTKVVQPITDWERLAIYFIEMTNFVTQSLGGKMTFFQVRETVRAPARLDKKLILATAEKLSLRIDHA